MLTPDYLSISEEKNIKAQNSEENLSKNNTANWWQSWVKNHLTFDLVSYHSYILSSL